MDHDFTLEDLLAPDSPVRVVLNSLFDGVYVTDKLRRVVLWNRGAEEITGYTAAEVEGRRCMDNILSHIDENGHLLCLGDCPLLKTIRTGEPQRAKIYPLHKSGRRFPVKTHIAPLRDRSGAVVAAIEVFRDVSQEEEFRLLQEKFNTIVQRYVSQTAYQDMMAQATSGAEGVAQIRDLTILNLDIVGFTTLSERLTPQEVVRMLNHLFGLCDVITTQHHGDIDKFIGDALLAVFIDANDAVQAARHIQLDALPHYNALRAEQGFDPVAVRVGINSGLVLQGDVGGAERKDLTVIGDVVNTAQRVETICAPGSVLITEAARSRLSETEIVRFRFHSEVLVKGKKQAVRVYEMIPEALG